MIWLLFAWNLALSVAFVVLARTFERYRRTIHEHDRTLDALAEYDQRAAEQINFFRGQFHQANGRATNYVADGTYARMPTRANRRSGERRRSRPRES